MKKERIIHMSSNSEYQKQAETHYVSENEIHKFEPKIVSNSQTEFGTTVTWKSVHTNESKTMATFTLNLRKISEEEYTFLLNEKLNGERVKEISSKNEY